MQVAAGSTERPAVKAGMASVGEDSHALVSLRVSHDVTVDKSGDHMMTVVDSLHSEGRSARGRTFLCRARARLAWSVDFLDSGNVDVANHGYCEQ